MFKKKSHFCAPPKPRAVLRIGFAGTRDVDKALLEPALEKIFSTISKKLVEFNHKERSPKGGEKHIFDFYSLEKPLLRFITGLAEGADCIAARTLEQFKPAFEEEIEYTLAGISPFDLTVYRESQQIEQQSVFDDLAQQCEYIVALDGKYDPSPGKTAFIRRKKAYSTQSQVLIRHCDLLIAATNYDKDPKAGGTFESMTRALKHGRCVIYIDTSDGQLYFIQPGDNFWTALSNPPSANIDQADHENSIEKPIHQLIDEILANPTIKIEDAKKSDSDNEELLFLQTYFNKDYLPKTRTNRKGSVVRKPSFREWLWGKFTKCFNVDDTPASDSPGEALESYRDYRSRSTTLNYHFSGLYRGTFLLNYCLAVIAVACAVWSITIVNNNGLHTDIGSGVAHIHEKLVSEKNNFEENLIHKYPLSDLIKSDSEKKIPSSIENLKIKAPDDTPGLVPPAPHASKIPSNPAGIDADADSHGNYITQLKFLKKEMLLLLLAAIKISAVLWISISTKRANQLKWNDLAVDYRYLSERLRTLYYLPLVSNFHPLDTSPAQYASRAVRQSATEWLFKAIARSVSPSKLCEKTQYERFDKKGCYEVMVQNIHPSEAILSFNESCVKNQVQYHKRNASTMYRFYHFTEKGVQYLIWGVIGVVLLDVAIVILNFNSVSGSLNQSFKALVHHAHGLSLWLLFFAALFPACVAALNGLRFQSECQRLFERSAMLRTLLGGSPPKTLDGLPNEHEGPKAKLTGGNWKELNMLRHKINQSEMHPEDDIGAWSSDALQLIEKISENLTREAAEWSVLYAKELAEP